MFDSRPVAVEGAVGLSVMPKIKYLVSLPANGFILEWQSITIWGRQSMVESYTMRNRRQFLRDKEKDKRSFY